MTFPLGLPKEVDLRDALFWCFLIGEVYEREFLKK
jgi:hypothetical protein